LDGTKAEDKQLVLAYFLTRRVGNLMDVKRLHQAISGAAEINLKFLLANIVVTATEGFETQAESVQRWITRLLNEFSPKQVENFVLGVTGSPTIPAGIAWPKEEQLKVEVTATENPLARTCFKTLFLPPYEDYNTFKDMMLEAMEAWSYGYFETGA